jgi:hypothetical protein
MKPEPMKPEDIIKETVEFYWPDPVKRRAVHGDKCHIVTPDGRMSAIGRCLNEKTLVAVKERKIRCDVEGLMVKLRVKSVQDLLRPEYQGHSLGFWEPLEHLHDNHYAWTSADAMQHSLRDLFPLFPFEILDLPPRP